MIAGIQFDGSGFSKLDCIGQQVIHYLFDAVHISIQIDIGIFEIRPEQDSLVSDYMGKARCDTFEQVIKAERDIIPGFFCLVQTVHVQQVVEQVYHVLADNPDIIQVGVPAFLLTGIHGQLGTAADDVQRGPDIMGYGQDNVFAHFQQCCILPYRFFQTFFISRLFPYIALNNQVRDNQQDDGEDYQTSYYKGGMFV
mgnify:CR=1 FL=1